MERPSRNFQPSSSNRKLQAIFASPNRYFTGNSRSVPLPKLYDIFLGTTCLPSQEGRRFFTFKRIRMSTYYFNKRTATTTRSHFLYGCPGAFLYSPPPPPLPHPTTRRCSRAICFIKLFLFVLMTLITSIITFSNKKIGKKKCYPQPSTWNPRPSTLDEKIDSLPTCIKQTIIIKFQHPTCQTPEMQKIASNCHPQMFRFLH